LLGQGEWIHQFAKARQMNIDAVLGNSLIDMERNKAKPDSVNIHRVLSACCHGGLVDEGREQSIMLVLFIALALMDWNKFSQSPVQSKSGERRRVRRAAA
jgi:hypothetical protein